MNFIRTLRTLKTHAADVEKQKRSTLNQANGIRRHAFLTTREAKLLSRGGLDADTIHVNPHHLSQRLLHLWNVRVQFRSLGTYSAVDVAHMIPLSGNQFDGLTQQNLAVYALEIG